MSSVETEQTIERPSEDERVVQWRLEELERAGYDQVSALEVALAGEVDLHLARSLVRQGCPVATACRILL